MEQGAFKFKAGDIVNFTNDQGVKFGKRLITEPCATSYGNAYKIFPTDTPWFAIPERNFAFAD